MTSLSLCAVILRACAKAVISVPMSFSQVIRPAWPITKVPASSAEGPPVSRGGNSGPGLNPLGT